MAAATFVTPVTPGTSAITAQTQSAPPTSWSVTSTQNPGPTPDPTPDPAPTPTPQPNFPASAQVPAILENQWMISSFEDALEWNNLEEWTWSQSGSPLGWNWVKTWSGQSPGERSQIGMWQSNGGEGGGNGSAAEASIRVIPVSISQGLQWESAPFPLQVTGSWTTSLTSTGGLGLPPDNPGTNSGEMVLRAHPARIGETYGGTIRKIRLRRHPGHDPRLTFSRSFIKVVEITGQPIAYEGVTLTIQPGQANSKPIILNGMASVHGQTRSERLLPVEFEVTKWEPEIIQPESPYTTPWGDRQPPQNKPEDALFVGAESNDEADTFKVKAEVRMKPLAVPNEVADRIASEWKISMHQNIYALQTPDILTYLHGTWTYLIAPIPCMDQGQDPFDHKIFASRNEVIAVEHGDSPRGPHTGIALYRSRPGVIGATEGADPDNLQNSKRNVTFVTWVYAEHLPSGSRQFLKWVRWQAAWNVDVDGNNFAPPRVTTKQYVWRILDEGSGNGPIPNPSFTQFPKNNLQWTPAQ